jgi:DNA invertase Pin-like site-specific DNA recombinase
MITQEEVLLALRAKNAKPSDKELRSLPFNNAFLELRLSSPGQVKESRESIHEIAELLRLAKQDGFHSNLVPADIEDMLLKIQKDLTCKSVLTDGQITIDFRDLGISGTLSSNDRPGLKHLINSIEEGTTGTVYVTEASRLTRDQRRITPYTLLELFKQNSIRVRTPEYIKNPQIPKDWDDLKDDLEEGIEELGVMARRLNRKRRQKAGRGEYVGGPVPAGFIVDIKETEASGHHIFGKLKRYPSHAEIVEKVLKALIQNRYSEMATHHALGGLMYPLFPPELKYMERISSLRRATKIDEVGYLISPSMIGSLANNPTLIGIWTYGDIDPIPDNHDKAVPVELWLEAHQGFNNAIKPRGCGARHEPLEWNGILWCYNDDEPKLISGHASKNAYRCQSDYVQGRGPECLDIAAHLLDKPLTGAVLQQLDFTPFSEQVLMQLETEVTHSNIEDEQRKREIIRLSNRLKNLKSYLGDSDKKKEDFYWEQIDETQHQLDELSSRPAPIHRVQAADYEKVRTFLAGISENWRKYSRTFRNRILKLIIDKVEIRHKGQHITATIRWKTGQVQVVNIQRPRAIGNLESRWNQQERDLLKMLWPSSSLDAVLAAFPGRTRKSIAHQAYKQGWHRARGSSKHTPRRQWASNEDDKAKRLYEAGTPITDIASNVGRSYTAVLQRSWAKGWQRPNSDQRMTVAESSNTNQNPEVSKRVSSGSVFGGQVTTLR